MSHKRRSSVHLEFTLPLLLLLALTLGYFWRILLTSEAWKPAGGGDLVSFLFPTYRYAAASFWAGELPLWNPHLFGGTPFLADMQTGLFYPINLLLDLLGPDFPYKTMEWMSVLHVFLAGAFMYVCLRTMEPNRPIRVPAALVGAIAFMFSDLYIVHFGNLNLIGVASWLPLIFLLFWRALRTRSMAWAVGAGVVLAIATLEGHLQVTLYIGLALLVATVIAALDARRSRQSWGRPFLALAVTAGVAMALSALVLLPAIEFVGKSARSELSYWDAARYSLIPGLLGEMLVPALFGSREPSLYWGAWDRVAVGYVGIFSLILAGLAILLRRGRRTRLFAVLALVAILLALGSESVFHGWSYRLLPGFGQLRAPARMIVILDFALAALAALGLDQLLQALDRRRRRAFAQAFKGLLWFGGAAILVGGAWAYLVVFQAQGSDLALFGRVSAASSGVIFALLMLAASLAWLAARRYRRLGRKGLAWLAVVLVFIDLATIGAYTDMGREAPTEGYNHPEIVRFLQEDTGEFRIDSDTGIADRWQPDSALLYGLHDLSGVDNPLLIEDVVRYMEGTGGRSTPLYDFLGARYVLGSKDVTLDWGKFNLAYDGDPALNVYYNESAVPRAQILHRAVAAADHEDAWQLLHTTGFDPTQAVILEGGESLDGNPAEAGDAEVRITHYGPNRIEVDVNSAAEGYVVLSDPFYPGWQAKVDGEPAAIARANYAFRAVPVPPGTHRVTMNFRPTSWYAGLGISAASLLVLMVLAIAVLVRWRRRAG